MQLRMYGGGMRKITEGTSMIMLHHENGDITTITDNGDGTTTTSGWYGGSRGVTSPYPASDIEDEVNESANKYQNKIIKIIRN